METPMIITVSQKVEIRQTEKGDMGQASSTITGILDGPGGMNAVATSNLVYALYQYIKNLTNGWDGPVIIKLGDENLVIPPRKKE